MGEAGQMNDSTRVEYNILMDIDYLNDTNFNSSFI